MGLLCMILTLWIGIHISRCGPASISFTDGFKAASSYLRSAVNFSADPCQDFYNYACGNWEANNAIESDKTSVSSFVILRKKVQLEMRELLEQQSEEKSNAKKMVRIIYNKCADGDSFERNRGQDMIKAIKAVGSWPMIEGSTGSFNPRDFDLTSLLVEVGIRGVSPFIDVYISADFTNTSRRIIGIDQGGLGLGSSSRNYYLNTTKYEKYVKAYKDYIFEKTSLITEDYGAPLSPAALRSDVDEIFALEQRVAKILVAREDRRNFTQLHNIRKLSQLKELFPLIDWNRYFKSSTPFDLHDYIDSDPDVTITEIDYLHRLGEVLSTTEPRVVANYIMLRYSGSFSLLYDKRYEDTYQRLVRVLLGREMKSDRWKECVGAATGKMSYAASALYASKFFNEDAKATTMSMIDEIKQAFDGLIKKNTWMDNDTRIAALKKSDEMIRHIGFADWILNDNKLDEWYEGLDINNSDTLLSIIEKVHRWSNDKAYRRLLKPVDRNEFSTNSATVNAFYSSTKNSITFPAGILQAPFFNKDYPKALNYGGIGAVIGHEITHGFDDQGYQFDGLGNLHQWWKEGTMEEFKNRSLCMVYQYGNLTVPEIELPVNGKLTQGENIADNGGIKAAYWAYKSFLSKGGEEPRLPGMSHITNDQLFFIGYAQSWCSQYKPEALTNLMLTDTHAPGMFRATVPAMNQPEFAAAFHCPAGSVMNPHERCSLW